MTKGQKQKAAPKKAAPVQRKAPISKKPRTKVRGGGQDTDLRPSRGKAGNISDIGSYSSGYRPHVTSIPMRCEQLTDVSGSVLFTNQVQYPINPGLASSFPWLSQIAAAYEFYRFKHLSYEYRTTCGEVVSGTNPALGKVVMATDYDVLDNPFTTKQQMENYEGNANCAPHQKVLRHVVNVEGRRMGQVLPYRERYVRSGAVPSTSSQGGAGDPHAYDIGLFQLGTAGMPAANPIGELWVCYSIDLIKPKTQTPLGQNLLQAHYQGAIPTTANNFVAMTQRVGTTLNLTFGTNTITFPVVGAFAVQVGITATTSTTAPTVASYGSGSVAISTLGPSGSSQIAGGTVGTMAVLMFQVNVTTPGAVVTLTPATIVAGLTCDVTAYQFSPGLAALASSSSSTSARSKSEERLLRLERLLELASIAEEDEPMEVRQPGRVLSRGIRPIEDHDGFAYVRSDDPDVCGPSSIPPRVRDPNEVAETNLARAILHARKRFGELPDSA